MERDCLKDGCLRRQPWNPSGRILTKINYSCIEYVVSISLINELKQYKKFPSLLIELSRRQIKFMPIKLNLYENECRLQYLEWSKLTRKDRQFKLQVKASAPCL